MRLRSLFEGDARKYRHIEWIDFEMAHVLADWLKGDWISNWRERLFVLKNLLCFDIQPVRSCSSDVRAAFWISSSKCLLHHFARLAVCIASQLSSGLSQLSGSPLSPFQPKSPVSCSPWRARFRYSAYS